MHLYYGGNLYTCREYCIQIYLVNEFKAKDSNTKTNAQKVGSSFEGIIKGITDGINSVVDDVAKVANGAGDCAGFGNSCSTTNTTETDTELRNKYSLDNKMTLPNNLVYGDIYTVEDFKPHSG